MELTFSEAYFPSEVKSNESCAVAAFLRKTNCDSLAALTSSHRAVMMLLAPAVRAFCMVLMTIGAINPFMALTAG